MTKVYLTEYEGCLKERGEWAYVGMMANMTCGLACSELVKEDECGGFLGVFLVFQCDMNVYRIRRRNFSYYRLSTLLIAAMITLQALSSLLQVLYSSFGTCRMLDGRIGEARWLGLTKVSYIINSKHLCLKLRSLPIFCLHLKTYLSP